MTIDMRPIRFRGKCVADSKYAGQWATGGYCEPDEECPEKYKSEGLIVANLGGNCQCEYHVIPDTVGQFTGVLDKNGEEIYEGDIIQALDSQGEPMRHQVYYLESEARFATKLVGYDMLGEGDLTQRWINEIGFEIIGNIHDNPKLLKLKKK